MSMETTTLYDVIKALLTPIGDSLHWLTSTAPGLGICTGILVWCIGSMVWSVHSTGLYKEWRAVRKRYRKLQWSDYPPPEGEEWHNPYNLTPKQVGVQEGWRLALKSEVKDNSPIANICEVWNKYARDPRWFNGEWLACDTTLAYRTLEPVPVPVPVPKSKKEIAAERLQYLILKLNSLADIKLDPWAAYPPPKGEEWHNPQNLTPEQVGVKDGWRLALKSEVCDAHPIRYKCEMAFSEGGAWEGGLGHGDTVYNTYRTKEPLPLSEEDKELAHIMGTELARDRLTIRGSTTGRFVEADFVDIEARLCSFLAAETQRSKQAPRQISLAEWRKERNNGKI